MKYFVCHHHPGKSQVEGKHRNSKSTKIRLNLRANYWVYFGILRSFFDTLLKLQYVNQSDASGLDGRKATKCEVCVKIMDPDLVCT